jgi:tRNA-dihydrouridine synthase
VQFCANLPQLPMLIEACKLVEGKCDVVELNVGCPQRCARKGQVSGQSPRTLTRDHDVPHASRSTVPS